MAESGDDRNAAAAHNGDKSIVTEEVSPETIFSTKTWREDVTLLVEDKPLHVNKHVLAYASPVFNVMFSGGFKEKDLEEIPLPDKKYDDFVEFLQCMYPGIMKSVTLKNVFTVLPLAHEYQVKTLESACDICLVQYLSQSNDPNIVNKFLETACTYKLDKAFEKCVKLVAEQLDDNKFESNVTLPDEVRNAIRTKRLHILRTKYKDVFGHIKTSRALQQFLCVKAKEKELFEKYTNGRVIGDKVDLTVSCGEWELSGINTVNIDGTKYTVEVDTRDHEEFYLDCIGLNITLQEAAELTDKEFFYALHVLNRIDGKEFISTINKFQLNLSNNFVYSEKFSDLKTETLRDQLAGFVYKGNIEMCVYLFCIKNVNKKVYY